MDRAPTSSKVPGLQAPKGMKPLSRTAAALTGPAHALLRVGAGLLFLQHGLQKIFGLLGGSTVSMVSLLGVARMLELLGGIALVIGLWTRPVAFVLTGQMLIAFLIAHFPRGGWPIQNGGELPLLYALVFAFLTATGSGPASIDQRRPARQS